MKLTIDPGKYVVAVSGGVDSMALLHMLAGDEGFEPADAEPRLIVAHMDHGIRPDAAADRRLVQAVAAAYSLPCIYERAGLGVGASEAAARQARYAFLRRVMAAYGAHGIITAHHQDDVLETAIMNLVRGTGRRGLSSLRSGGGVVRPLLDVPKQALQDYALQHRLQWREDSTNTDERYLRNYVRRRVVARLTPRQRAQLLGIVKRAAALNDEIDAALAHCAGGRTLDRRWFIMLPYDVSAEVMAAWLRTHGCAFDRRSVDRLCVFAKTARAGKRASISGGQYAAVDAQNIVLTA